MKNQKGLTLIELLIVLAILGLVTAIALPGLLRARVSANEAEAIADTRGVISAGQSYAAANCGCFAQEIVDYTVPTIPGYVGPEFLSEDLTSHGNTLDKSGYKREYSAVTMPARVVLQWCLAKSRCASFFTYHSTPLIRRVTGVRSFVGLASGTIWANGKGAKININDDGGVSPTKTTRPLAN